MKTAHPKTLIYGYGNPGRQDDGLGVLLSEAIEKWAQENHYPIETDSNYQLSLEDAEKIAHYERVIFADASQEADLNQFKCSPLLPSFQVDFSMHAISPAFILHLCDDVFQHKPEAYLLHIRGYEWEFMKEMTSAALENLEQAIAYVKELCVNTK